MAKIDVAPLAGAWIEMQFIITDKTCNKVAPLAGAWIEIETLVTTTATLSVAPLAGAWIEIKAVCPLEIGDTGRSPRGSVD